MGLPCLRNSSQQGSVISPLDSIKKYVDVFIEYCKNNKDKKFLVTEIGCGLVGYSIKDMAPMFKECINIENIFLPKKFVKEIKK